MICANTVRILSCSFRAKHVNADNSWFKCYALNVKHWNFPIMQKYFKQRGKVFFSIFFVEITKILFFKVNSGGGHLFNDNKRLCFSKSRGQSTPPPSYKHTRYHLIIKYSVLNVEYWMNFNRLQMLSCLFLAQNFLQNIQMQMFNAHHFVIWTSYNTLFALSRIFNFNNNRKYCTVRFLQSVNAHFILKVIYYHYYLQLTLVPSCLRSTQLRSLLFHPNLLKPSSLLCPKKFSLPLIFFSHDILPPHLGTACFPFGPLRLVYKDYLDGLSSFFRKRVLVVWTFHYWPRSGLLKLWVVTPFGIT